MSASSSFIDKVKIFIKGGDGGKGCISFRRESCVPRGGPNGGDGGRGGNVILEGDSGLLTLLDFKYHPHIRASRGDHGRGKDCNGKKGSDVICKVPLGTITKDFKTNKKLGEILFQGQQLIAAKGGRGGRGNKQFATSTNRAPRRAEPGSPGEEKELVLELKLIADVGLVGAPNAGKSTLINYISTTRSKVAAYPFTTLNPVLGVVALEEHSSFDISYEKNISKFSRLVIADIPGIIKDAHKGKGLGDRFLRHIERSSVLVFILDSGGDLLGDYAMLRSELEQYDSSLLKKPYMVAVNKMDLEINKDNFNRFLKLSGENKKIIFPISALNGEGVECLLKHVRRKLVETFRDN